MGAADDVWLGSAQGEPVGECLATLATQFPWGVVLLDGRLRLAHLNGIAREIISLGDGLWVSRGELHASVPDAERPLREILKEVANSETQAGDAVRSFWLERPSGEAPFLVSVTRLGRPGYKERDPHYIAVHILDPESPGRSPATNFRRFFDLSPGETSLACGLLEGATLSEIADEHAVKPTTLRQQLQGLFAKTGTRRQSALIALLLRISLFPGLSNMLLMLDVDFDLF